MDAEAAATAEAINGRAASKATAEAITMEAATEAVADAAEVALEAELNRALTCTMR